MHGRAMLKLISAPKFQLTAQHVESRLMALVDVGPGSPSGWKARDAQKERFRANCLSAHSRFVIRSLFGPVLGSGPDDGRGLCNICTRIHSVRAYHCHDDLPFQQSTMPHHHRWDAGSPEDDAEKFRNLTKSARVRSCPASSPSGRSSWMLNAECFSAMGDPLRSAARACSFSGCCWRRPDRWWARPI